MPPPIAYILAKNEEANIERSVRALRDAGVSVVVLDSGSTDRTRELAKAHGAEVRDYVYTTHADAYRQLSRTGRRSAEEAIFVLDADMIVSQALVAEALGLVDGGASVVLAPIRMCWSGRPLSHASLCPPKAILFRTGGDYFEPVGHGERVRNGVATAMTSTELLHDDRKPLGAYLSSQERYARSFLERAHFGELTIRDRVRMWTPIMVAATPLVSYLLRGGILDGWSGLGYALDRAIAEAIMAREAIARRVTRDLADRDRDAG